MKTYGLIGIHDCRVDTNPGGHFIIDGIRWLIRQIDPSAVILPIDLFEDDVAGWETALAQADILLLCGNPRFNLDEREVYWDTDIWHRITQARDAGIPFIDAWAGAAHPLPVVEASEMVEAIAAIPKTKTILSFEKGAELCIARDRVASELLRSCNENTELLPCSTWYAAAQFGIVSESKDRHCITLRKMPGYSWIIDAALALQNQLQRELPTYLLAHSHQDYEWVQARRNVTNLLCIADPESLLRFYSRVDKLLSYRIHASIPALSLGARVCNVSIDSRSLTVDEFGIESIPFTRMNEPDFQPQFSKCKSPPDAQRAFDALRAAFEGALSC